MQSVEDELGTTTCEVGRDGGWIFLNVGSCIPNSLISRKKGELQEYPRRVSAKQAQKTTQEEKKGQRAQRKTQKKESSAGIERDPCTRQVP